MKTANYGSFSFTELWSPVESLSWVTYGALNSFRRLHIYFLNTENMWMQLQANSDWSCSVCAFSLVDFAQVQGNCYISMLLLWSGDFRHWCSHCVWDERKPVVSLPFVEWVAVCCVLTLREFWWRNGDSSWDCLFRSPVKWTSSSLVLTSRGRFPTFRGLYSCSRSRDWSMVSALALCHSPPLGWAGWWLRSGEGGMWDWKYSKIIWQCSTVLTPSYFSRCLLMVQLSPFINGIDAFIRCFSTCFFEPSVDLIAV